ncbi:MAG: glycosyltransferase family 2 protein, partial [Sphaerospermopsis sp. SIO1G2]|nr:glycosyltransferase family 2 protein [Sphaerospermopsis sp. SIO1G2]
MSRLDTSGVVAVIPALNEEGSITEVIQQLLAAGVSQVRVGDNGSTDNTRAVAEAAGAVVIEAPQRGYGNACLAAMAGISDTAQAVVFCDADGADELAVIDRVVNPVVEGEADLVIGSRKLGGADKGALTLPQRIGNRVATTMMRLLYGQRVTDLGPFRCISCAALQRIAMSDPTYGWTTEMQVKAFRLGMTVKEVPVRAQLRTAGESKISGKLIPGLIAGKIILATVW